MKTTTNSCYKNSNKNLIWGFPPCVFCIAFLIFLFSFAHAAQTAVLPICYAKNSDLCLTISFDNDKVTIGNKTYAATPTINSEKMKSKKGYTYSIQFETLLNFCSANDAANFVLNNAEQIYNDVKSENCVDFCESKFTTKLGKTSYEVGKDGITLNAVDFYKALFFAVDGKINSSVYLVERKAESLDSLKSRTVLRGDFKTSFYSSGEGRSNNIALAASKIDGYMLLPNEVFSFNETVGKRTEENGFKEAKIIVDGEFTSGIGGGVCQVSTTLYNAALLAGLQIVEANQHSLPVSYVGPSLDAMVSNYSDLKIKNVTDKPIYIHGYVENKSVRFQIYGISGNDIKIDSIVTKTLPFDKKYVYDETLGEGDVIRQGKDGFESDAYLSYVENGMTIKRKIRHNVYKPQAELIATTDKSKVSYGK